MAKEPEAPEVALPLGALDAPEGGTEAVPEGVKEDEKPVGSADPVEEASEAEGPPVAEGEGPPVLLPSPGEVGWGAEEEDSDGMGSAVAEGLLPPPLPPPAPGWEILKGNEYWKISSSSSQAILMP